MVLTESEPGYHIQGRMVSILDLCLKLFGSILYYQKVLRSDPRLTMFPYVWGRSQERGGGMTPPYPPGRVFPGPIYDRSIA